MGVRARRQRQGQQGRPNRPSSGQDDTGKAAAGRTATSPQQIQQCGETDAPSPPPAPSPCRSNVLHRETLIDAMEHPEKVRAMPVEWHISSSNCAAAGEDGCSSRLLSSSRLLLRAACCVSVTKRIVCRTHLPLHRLLPRPALRPAVPPADHPRERLRRALPPPDARAAAGRHQPHLPVLAVSGQHAQVRPPALPARARLPTQP